METDERPQKIRKLSHSIEAAKRDLPAIEENPAHADKHDQAQEQREHQSQVNSEADPNTAIKPSTQNNEADSANLPPTNCNSSSAPPQLTAPLSKSQLKKLRKQQEWDAGKDFRKAKRKEKAKERRQRKRVQREQEAEDLKANGESVRQSRPRPIRHVRVPVTFLIDCGFDDKMTEKERISLASQVTRAYSDNHKAPYQAHLVVSSWGGHLKERFDTVLKEQHQNWKGIRFTEEDFVDAAVRAQKDMSGSRGGRLAGVFQQYSNTTPNRQQRSKDDSNAPVSEAVTSNGPESTGHQTLDHNEQPSDTSLTSAPEARDSTSTQPITLPEPETVYLTSDSPHTLNTLSPYSTYIIGGLVDKNRHKGICYRTATERNVTTAKLPIGELMEMQSRFVLATNHVVEIMVRWLECGDWGEAFMKVIPKRKGGKLRPSENGGGKDGGDDGKEERDGGSEDEDEDRTEGEDEDVIGNIDENDDSDDAQSEPDVEDGAEYRSTTDVTNAIVGETI